MSEPYLSALKWEPLLIRIQVQRGNPKVESSVDWSIALQPSQAAHNLIANLSVSSSRGTGSASAVGFITSTSDSITQDLDYIKQWSLTHTSEILYDVCRRALNRQASAMDLIFEIPAKAPDVPIEDFIFPEAPKRRSSTPKK